MQTLDEIKSISFRRSNIGGYRPDDVDTFVDDVITTIEQMQREKNDLLKKLEVLAKRIEDYKDEEDSVKAALLSAQKLGEQAIRDAQKKAEDIIREAQNKADKIRQDSNAYMIEQKSSLLRLHSESAKLRNQLLETYKKHLQMIDTLPTMEVVKDKKADLDEKFPTDPLPGEAPAPVREKEKEKEKAKEKAPVAEEPKPEKPVADKPRATADREPSPSSESNNLSSFSDKGTYTSEKKKSGSRFADLQFGADFDISSKDI